MRNLMQFDFVFAGSVDCGLSSVKQSRDMRNGLLPMKEFNPISRSNNLNFEKINRHKKFIPAASCLKIHVQDPGVHSSINGS